MTPSRELAEQLQALLAKGRRALISSRRDSQAGDYDFAASRAYYAAFYALEALLLTEDVTCSTHSGAIREFSRLFVATGILPKDFGRKMARLFRERQTGDYSIGVSIDQSDAEDDIDCAQDILNAAEQYLTKSGFLSL